MQLFWQQLLKSFAVWISLKTTSISPLTLLNSCFSLLYGEITELCSTPEISLAMLSPKMPEVSPTMEKLGHVIANVDVTQGTVTFLSANASGKNTNGLEAWKVKNIYSNIPTDTLNLFIYICLVCLPLGFSKHNAVLVFLQWLMHVHIVEIIHQINAQNSFAIPHDLFMRHAVCKWDDK